MHMQLHKPRKCFEPLQTAACVNEEEKTIVLLRGYLSRWLIETSRLSAFIARILAAGAGADEVMLLDAVGEAGVGT